MENLELILLECEEQMTASLEALKRNLALIRTGKANPGVLNGIEVDYYGVLTPLHQIASVSTPEAQLLVIKPYDKNALKDIERALHMADLNLTPQNDGTVIRIVFPALTEERRKEYVKEARSLGEELKISIRHHRREAVDAIKKLEKDSLISEDEMYAQQEEVQKLTDEFIEKIGELVKDKEATIMEI